jgi:PTS system nitrogen regulatory IIA component
MDTLDQIDQHWTTMDKTFIGVKEIAGRMGVSEKTIYRMVNDNRIPFAVKIGGQWRFRIDALTGWLNRQENNAMPVMGAINSDIALHEALQQGAVLYRIHGHNRDEIIDELLTSLPYSSAFDLNELKVSIFSRESVVSSSLNGIAFLMTDPGRPVFFERTMILLAFLESPVDLKAIDGIRTEAIFLILPANTIEQNIIDVKLRRLFMDSDFVAAIRQQPGRKELFDLLSGREEQIFGPRP